METILQGQKDIKAVYTHDDDMAMGVVQAIRAANREDEMFVTGAGGSKDAMNLIAEGTLYGQPSSTTHRCPGRSRWPS